MSHFHCRRIAQNGADFAQNLRFVLANYKIHDFLHFPKLSINFAHVLHMFRTILSIFLCEIFTTKTMKEHIFLLLKCIYTIDNHTE